MARKSKGRQRVAMVKMNNESNLQVTFSKRRTGLFKKASELCTLCGAEVAIVVFSPGRKVFSFGHPSVGTIIDRFLGGPNAAAQNGGSGTMQLIEAHRNATVRNLNAHLTQLLSQLEAEKKRGEEINDFLKANQGNNWWESPIDDLNPSQLDHLSSALQDLKKSVAAQAEKLLIQSAAPHHHPLHHPHPHHPQQFFVGSSSGSAAASSSKPPPPPVGFTGPGGSGGFVPPFGYKPEYGLGPPGMGSGPVFRTDYGSVYKPEFNGEYKPEFDVPGYGGGYGPPPGYY